MLPFRYYCCSILYSINEFVLTTGVSPKEKISYNIHVQTYYMYDFCCISWHMEYKASPEFPNQLWCIKLTTDLHQVSRLKCVWSYTFNPCICLKRVHRMYTHIK